MLNNKHKVTVLIPVGPFYRADWLQEAINSVFQQTYAVDEILFVNDGAGITDQHLHEWVQDVNHEWELCWYKESEHAVKHWLFGISGKQMLSLWRSPANIGFAQAFNCGIALAENELVMYLASDDTLGPDAVKDCLETYEANNEKDAWYSLTYQSDEGISDIPINAAMVTRNLWKWMKGYPPSAFAGPDALLLSCLLAHAPDRIIKVAPGKVNYYIKMHPDQDTKKQFSFFAASGIMEVIRNMETQRFTPDERIILR